MTALLSDYSAKLALLGGLIDDASLFPPAQLGMRPALRVHARNRESAYAFVQGRFVVAASRSAELLAAHEPGVPLRLSVILDVATGEDAVGGAIARLGDLAPLRDATDITIDSYEVRLPREHAQVEAMAALIDAIVQSAPTGAPQALWCEAAFDAGWIAAPEATLAAISKLRDTAAAGVTVGAKVRCGGLAATMIPSITDLSRFLTAAEASGVPWKATAGLHHPVRRANREATMHGFLNVFVAGIALHTGALAADRVTNVLGEEDPRAFTVDSAHVAWRDVSLDVDALKSGRERCVSYGSCSFFEPVDDLRRLGMLG